MEKHIYHIKYSAAVFACQASFFLHTRGIFFALLPTVDCGDIMMKKREAEAGAAAAKEDKHVESSCYGSPADSA